MVPPRAGMPPGDHNRLKPSPAGAAGKHSRVRPGWYGPPGQADGDA